jgi:hypothetical protein
MNRAEVSFDESGMCLPTAPGLPIEANGDFGTSPFFGQRSDKQLLEPHATVHWFWPT